MNFNKDALIQNKTFEADSMFSRITELNYFGHTDLQKYFNFTESKENSFSFAVKNSLIKLAGSSIVLFNAKKKTSQILNSNASLTLRNLHFPKRRVKTFSLLMILLSVMRVSTFTLLKMIPFQLRI